MRHAIRGLLVLAVFLCLPVIGLSAAHAGAVVVKQEATTTEVDLHEGALIKLDRPVSTVFVADASVADVQVKSPRLIYLFGKTVGETTLYAVDDNENVVASMTVRVNHNLTRLNDAIRALGAGPDVKVRSVDKGIVVEGDVQSAKLAADIQDAAGRFINPKEETILNRLAITSPTQVNLRVRVAEVKRSALKQLGFNWDALLSIGSFALGLAVGLPTSVGVFPTDNQIRNNNDSNALFAGVRANRLAIDGIVDALHDEGLLKFLAEPNLTALSGETATFLAGGEFPIPVSQDNSTITVEFKQFGVFLSFTPVVLENGRISMRVAPEVSELSDAGAVTIAGFTIPALTVRKATTTIELGSGQSFAMAGLIQNNSNQTISKFPGLGEVPVLGTLFRSDDFQREETELVIICTPYLVRPVSKPIMADPTQGLEPPNDKDRYVYGRNYSDLTGAAAAPGAAPIRRRDGMSSSGYMVE